MRRIGHIRAFTGWYIEARMMNHDWGKVGSAATMKAAMAKEDNVVGVRFSPQLPKIVKSKIIIRATS